MKKLFSERPFFLLLIPMFYLLTSLNDYYPVLKWADLLHPVSLVIVALHAVLFILSTLVWKQQRRYTLLLLYVSIVYLFFGSLHGFVKGLAPFLARYTIFPIGLGIIGVVLMIAIRRSKSSFQTLFVYLNTLLIVLTIYEAGRCTVRGSSDLSTRLGPDYRKDADFNAALCDTCERPDIYFLVFDGYSGSGTLKKYWNYDNSGVDTFLRQQGYFLADRARSNYNFTPYSIGSVLNMDYHRKAADHIDLRQFCRGVSTMRPNKVFELLRANQYAIINQSFFPVSKEAPALDISYAASEKHMLLAQTLPTKLLEDVGWNFGMHRSAASIREEIDLARLHRSQINKAYEALVKTSAAHQTSPVFVYTHFLFPHDPYFYDSTGKETPPDNWFNPVRGKEDYLSQLKYANTFIRDLAARLKKDARRPRIVIMISDHGFRGFKGDGTQPWEFNNLFAVYFPDGDYSSLHDSVSAVNTFPLVFNKYFKAGIAMKKDTSFYSPH